MIKYFTLSFIDKICNSLVRSASHWYTDGYYLRNKQEDWAIWISNKDYGISIWKQGDWKFNRNLEPLDKDQKKRLFEYVKKWKSGYKGGTR